MKCCVRSGDKVRLLDIEENSDVSYWDKGWKKRVGDEVVIEGEVTTISPCGVSAYTIGGIKWPISAMEVLSE